MDEKPTEDYTGPPAWLLAGVLTWVVLVVVAIVIQQVSAPTHGVWGPWEILGHVIGGIAGFSVALRVYSRDKKQAD